MARYEPLLLSRLRELSFLRGGAQLPQNLA